MFIGWGGGSGGGGGEGGDFLLHSFNIHPQIQLLAQKSPLKNDISYNHLQLHKTSQMVLWYVFNFLIFSKRDVLVVVLFLLSHTYSFVSCLFMHYCVLFVTTRNK